MADNWVTLLALALSSFLNLLAVGFIGNVRGELKRLGEGMATVKTELEWLKKTLEWLKKDSEK